MGKEDFMTLLADKGYKVVNEDGCIMVIHPEKRTLEEITWIAREAGYMGGMGWRKGDLK